MREPADIQITYDGDDITDWVLFASAKFEAQSSAGVGTFSLNIKDPDRSRSFTSGKEIVLFLDGVRYFGGYLMQVGQTFAFPVVDTAVVSNVTARTHVLRGVNYNVLFDRLVTRNPSNYFEFLPEQPGSTQAGVLVTQFAQNYIDLPVGFNVTTFVDDVLRVQPDDTGFLWKQQGTPWRDQMVWMSLFNGAVYYIDASKNLHYHAPESVFSRWGFSDRPNKDPVPNDDEFTGATYPFRELDADEDISGIVNDIFVWGGSPFVASTDPGASGTVFARRQNTTSITSYGRWQSAETRWGELGGQSEVDARAEAIVPPTGDGPPGVGSDGVIRNRSKPSQTVRLSWFAHDVPLVEGSRDHLRPGDVVTIILYTHGVGETPLTLTLPLRRVTISFPTLPSGTGGDMKTFARFEGEFGLSIDDPYNVWEAILNRAGQINRTINSAGSPTATGSPGSLWQGEPVESPNGSLTTFTLESVGTPISYVAASSSVYVNGLRKSRDIDYTENPASGTITFTSAPSTGADLWVMVRLAG